MLVAPAPAADVLIVGGGVAGLSVAASLAGRARVVLLEQEGELARHASGDNAAIFRPLEHDDTSAALALRSTELLAAWGASEVLRRSGLLLVRESAEQARELARHADAQGVQQAVFTRGEILERAPMLSGGDAEHAVWLPQGGLFDVHALNAALARAAQRGGAELRRNTRVARVVAQQGRVAGVELQDGTRLHAAHVVLAAGAWGAGLGRACGAPLPMVSLRRHLVSLRTAAPLAAGQPVVWRLDDEVYFRPDAHGVLASPCEEDACDADGCSVDPAAVERLRARLARLAPRVLEGSSVSRVWACLRTFAADREILAGPDPRLPGLHWLAALGGRGMSVAPAAGELVAGALLGGAPHELEERLHLARLL